MAFFGRGFLAQAVLVAGSVGLTGPVLAQPAEPPAGDTTEPAEPAPEPAPPRPEGTSAGPTVGEPAPVPPAAPVAPASADTVNDLPPPTFWEGGGVRVGDDSVLHPVVSLTTSYQSNVFFQDPKDRPSGPLAAPLLRVGAGASWASLSPARMEIEAPEGGAQQRLTFNLDANLEWNQYLSGNSAVSAQSDLGIGFLGDVKINPQGVVSLELRDGFVRNVSPGQSVRENTDRDRNELATALHVRPGGGAIDLFAGYTFIVDLFETSAVYYENRLTHQGVLGARWQWLPMTVIALDASIASVTPSNLTFKASSTPVRATLGISSLITPVLGVVANAGYGNGLYASGENVSTWLALAELRYALGPTVRLAVGYSHDFADALIGNFYADHTGYLRASAQLGQRWQIHAKAEARLRTYGGIKDAPMLIFCGDVSCAKTRSDFLPRADVGTDYALLPWLLVGAQYLFQADSTDFYVVSVGGADRGAYTWHEVDVRVQARW